MQAGREIKFQVWDQDTRKMWTWEDIIEAESAMFITLLEFLQQDQFIKRQFTGLCDKNSKEIYEGDVGEEDGVFYQVIWVDSGAMYGAKVIKTDFVLTRQLTFPLQQYIIEGTKVCNFEIIGNIYENPELLEVGN